jgi:hypothetical protein
MPSIAIDLEENTFARCYCLDSLIATSQPTASAGTISGEERNDSPAKYAPQKNADDI